MVGDAERQQRDLSEQLERLAAVITALTREVEQLQQWHPLAGRLRWLLWRSFLQGIAGGIGRAVGATVVLGLLVWLLSRLQVVPVLGVWIARLMEAIQAAQQGF